MKTTNKILLFIALFILFTQQVFAQITNDSQLIKSNHWVYDAIYTLSYESKEVLFLDNPPLSVGELKFHLRQLDYEKLSDSGKVLYDDVYNFLYTTNYIRKEKFQKIIKKGDYQVPFLLLFFYFRRCYAVKVFKCPCKVKRGIVP